MTADEADSFSDEMFGGARSAFRCYADVAPLYLAGGWNPLPMDPTDNKATPPKGFTGYNGRAVTKADVVRWSRSKAHHHVSLRLPPGVIGVDVDQYDAKHGAEEIAKLEAELGPLPATWVTTSRPGTPSGIRLFKVPVGLRFPTRPCPDVEFIQPHHRHAVAWPSTHRERRVPYVWVDPNGATEATVPDVDDLTELPWAWVERFARRGPAGEVAEQATTEQVATFIAQHTDNRRPSALKGITTKLHDAAGSRHDTLVEFACWAMREAAAGRFPAAAGVAVLEQWWVQQMTAGVKPHDRDRLTDTEFGDAVAWAVAQVLGPDADRVTAMKEADMADDDDEKNSETEPFPATPAAVSCTLGEVHDTFRKWLGAEYDLDALDAMLAAIAVERLTGDPVWLLIVSGSGNAKTETVQSAAGTGAHITSTITSVGALLSASPKRDKAKDATGGLLRKIGDRGVIVIKDVTSILSQNSNTRVEVLAAMREVYDGYWERNVGTDGGRTLLWSGRIALVGAVTTAWDRAHDVVAAMGDRFVLLRSDSAEGRLVAGRRSIANTGDEVTMRTELAAAVAGLIAGIDTNAPMDVDDTDVERLLAVADVVTIARTAVDYDYRGNVIDAHAPEMPTRFAKQLAQIVRGGVAIGLTKTAAMRLAIRCGRDSMPPLRLAILLDVAANPYTTAYDARKRLQKPHSTVDRQLQSLHMLGLLLCDEETTDGRTRWRYSLSNGVDPGVFRLSPEKLVNRDWEKKKEGDRTVSPSTHISGDSPADEDDDFRVF